MPHKDPNVAIHGFIKGPNGIHIDNPLVEALVSIGFLALSVAGAYFITQMADKPSAEVTVPGAKFKFKDAPNDD